MNTDIKKKFNKYFCTPHFQETRYISCGQCDSVHKKSRLHVSPVSYHNPLTNMRDIRHTLFELEII